MKSKEAHSMDSASSPQASSGQVGKFVVGFTDPLDVDVNFNWWIVETQTESSN